MVYLTILFGIAALAFAGLAIMFKARHNKHRQRVLELQKAFAVLRNLPRR